MATSTRKPTTSSARRGSGGSSSRASTGTTRGGGRKKAGKGSGGGGSRGTTRRALASLRANVGDRRIDIIGLGLLMTAILVGLALWFGSGGVVGNWLAAAALGLAGRLAYVVPLSLFYVGCLVLYSDGERETPRILIGMTLTWVGVLGGWHLLSGTPRPTGRITDLYDSGGLLGYAISRPLQVAASTAGAALVVALVLLVGLLIWTRTTFRDFAHLVGRVVVRSATEVRGLLAGGPGAGEPETGPDGGGDGAGGDDAHGTADEPASRARRGRRTRRTADVEAEASSAPATVPPPATVPAPPPGRPGPAQPEGDDPGDAQGAPPLFSRRPVAVYDAGEQLPLDDGLTAADRAAGRIPAPVAAAAADLPAPVERTADGTRKARKVVPRGPSGYADYALPPLDMLAHGRSAERSSERHIAAQVEALQATFDQFKIDATVARWSRGPTVTTYEIELGAGVPVKKVANLGDDIAYALAAPDVRIVAPIPGKSAIGVEVPNRQRDRITLGDVLRSDAAQSDPHPLLVALGVDANGNAALVDLATMPHLLVSGATGSGKSVTLNAMITSIICRARPDQVRMILVDPKRVELNSYEGVPHLLTPVVTDPKRAADAIQWAVKEMELRYDTLARLGYRNIDGYNDAVARDALPVATDEERAAYRRMPYILLVIDELADLMLVAPRDVEEAICRIAQMARAVGIHMVIATQRPSVDVITGLIKANIPSRLALAVSSQTDSRTILDMAGAEKLVGHGDMLFLPASQGKPSRLQGCFISETEIVPVVQHCVEQREAAYVEGVVKSGDDALKADSSRGSNDDSDEALLRRAAIQVTESGLGSVSMLQRKLRIGFARAGRLMDELEEVGCVGPNEGSKAREVLWTPEMVQQAIDGELL